MPKKRLLKKVEVETAQRKRTCKFSRIQIGKGETCLVVREGSHKRSCYSRSIALQMISEARKALDELEKQL